MHFCTRLPFLEILKKTFFFVSPRVTRRSLLLSKFQEFILVLIKLPLGVSHQDLAYHFNISRAVVLRIIVSWLTVMDVSLSPLISWPDREQLQRTMPRCFNHSFGLKTGVIIDCFEIFIQTIKSIGESLLTSLFTFLLNSIRLIISNRSRGCVYELNAKVERAD